MLEDRIRIIGRSSFDENALDLAIESFHQRERRFGKTSEQVLAGSHSQQ